jgi:hypothetical protein
MMLQDLISRIVTYWIQISVKKLRRVLSFYFIPGRYTVARSMQLFGTLNDGEQDSVYDTHCQPPKHSLLLARGTYRGFNDHH